MFEGLFKRKFSPATIQYIKHNINEFKKVKRMLGEEKFDEMYGNGYIEKMEDDIKRGYQLKTKKETEIMSPRTKSTEFPAVRVSPKLKAETEKAADMAQENLSEYIRKAVEMRNGRCAKSFAKGGDKK